MITVFADCFSVSKGYAGNSYEDINNRSTKANDLIELMMECLAVEAINDKDLIKSIAVTSSASPIRLQGDRSLRALRSYSLLNKVKNKNEKVLFLPRNPKDTCAILFSEYMSNRYAKESHKEVFERFSNDFMQSRQSKLLSENDYFDTLNEIAEMQSSNPEGYLMMPLERFIIDFNGSIKKISKFLGIELKDDINKMGKRQRDILSKSIGSWKDHFTMRISEQFDSWINENGSNAIELIYEIPRSIAPIIDQKFFAILRNILDLAFKVGSRLAARKHRVAVIEATSGGLIAAALLTVPGASSFFISSSVVYGVKGYSTTLPKQVLDRSGIMNREENYSGKDAYIESKRVFARNVSLEMRNYMNVQYFLVENGTTGPTFYIPGVERAFTAIAISSGPVKTKKSDKIQGLEKDRLTEKVIETQKNNSRELNMALFALNSLELLLSDIETARLSQSTALSKI